jgi:hypothetical protein
MKWLLALALMVIAVCGCRNSGQSAQDPFFGRTTLPAPATGAAGARSCDPYYQPPAGAPLQPIPQPQLGAPNTPGSPASPGYTPPANSPPAGYPASPGYGSPGGYGYQGASGGGEASAGLINTPAPTAADSLGSAPSIVRIPAGSEATPAPATVDRPAEIAADRTPIVRTLQPRPREPAGPADTATAGVAEPLTPTRAAAPGELIEITDLPKDNASSPANTARSGSETGVER